MLECHYPMTCSVARCSHLARYDSDELGAVESELHDCGPLCPRHGDQRDTGVDDPKGFVACGWLALGVGVASALGCLLGYGPGWLQ
jgi:hypothetical protein